MSFPPDGVSPKEETIQEEIRAGVQRILRVWQVDSDVEFCATSDILKYLDSKGVVVKAPLEFKKGEVTHFYEGLINE